MKPVISRAPATSPSRHSYFPTTWCSTSAVGRRDVLLPLRACAVHLHQQIAAGLLQRRIHFRDFGEHSTGIVHFVQLRIGESETVHRGSVRDVVLSFNRSRALFNSGMPAAV